MTELTTTKANYLVKQDTDGLYYSYLRYDDAEVHLEVDERDAARVVVPAVFPVRHVRVVGLDPHRRSATRHVDPCRLDGSPRVVGADVLRRLDPGADLDFLAIPCRQLQAALVGLDREASARVQLDRLLEHPVLGHRAQRQQQSAGDGRGRQVMAHLAMSSGTRA